MIQNLKAASLSFGANSTNYSARDAYENVVRSNVMIAQKQNQEIMNAQKQNSGKVPMQGAGEKLDVVA